ncbi:hypothetical protein EVAR_26474_1 [Eumeta japonica]|uniref:Uncharacterized protein n=1 Tax=Eumeta variegata TaxID=151549 RepID=A0A4C1VBA0_EUMVA|nr:hypothetical protein EVAR_26474_1 [Eumeta japonica]
MRVPVVHSPSITPQPPSVSPLLFPSDILLRIYIPSQEVGNALVTPTESRVSMSSGKWGKLIGLTVRLPWQLLWKWLQKRISDFDLQNPPAADVVTAALMLKRNVAISPGAPGASRADLTSASRPGTRGRGAPRLARPAGGVAGGCGPCHWRNYRAAGLAQCHGPPTQGGPGPRGRELRNIFLTLYLRRQCFKSEELDLTKSIPELSDATPGTSVHPDPVQPQQGTSKNQSEPYFRVNNIEFSPYVTDKEELERYRYELADLKMEANSLAKEWSLNPEFSKTRQRKVNRHFDKLCEDERLQDPENQYTDQNTRGVLARMSENINATPSADASHGRRAILALAALPSAFHFTPTPRPTVCEMR